jgi:hypothetical protein
VVKPKNTLTSKRKQSKIEVEVGLRTDPQGFQKIENNFPKGTEVHSRRRHLVLLSKEVATMAEKMKAKAKGHPLAEISVR